MDVLAVRVPLPDRDLTETYEALLRSQPAKVPGIASGWLEQT